MLDDISSFIDTLEVKEVQEEPVSEDWKEDLEKQALDNLVNLPQEIFIKTWQKEKRYKEAFKKILAEKGFVTDEDMNKELKKISFKEVKPRIYISGPISGHDINERRAEFQRAEYEMTCRGFDPVNPMKNGLPAEATTHEHMKRDIELLMTCDYIYMMRRWTHSKGCKVEFDVATAIGLPVLFEESGEITKFE